MGSAIVLGVMIVFLVVVLVGLLSSLDRQAGGAAPGDRPSRRGVRAVVGGGFLVGVTYGVFIGIQSGVETWRWLGRGMVDGLVVACAGAFYLGYQQRRRRAAAGVGRPTAASEPETVEETGRSPEHSARSSEEREGTAGGPDPPSIGRMPGPDDE